MNEKEINCIMQKMSGFLDNSQLMRLEKVLEDTAKGEEIVPIKTSEQLLEEFLAVKRSEGRSEKTLFFKDIALNKSKIKGNIMARKKIGDIIEIPLGNGINAYGRLHKEGALGIFAGRYKNYDEVPRDVGYYRFITLYKSDLSKLNAVGSLPFHTDEESWQPDTVVVDSLTKKGSLYHHGKIYDCSYEDCKDLEICAVWELPHLIDMLNGDNRWDNATCRPQNV